ncbi:AMP-binding protein [Glaciecola sp. 1036]|uniref:AMP-binding protein n=1 Tax=Alteromonadaceae TaxID=72275 RepID=UPI003D00565E
MATSTLIPNNIKCLADYIEHTFSEFQDRPAYSALGQEKTFAEIEDLSGKFASWLQHNTDLQPGDRIAIQLPNLIQHPIAVYGALRAGLVVVNTNPLYTPKEMLHQFNDSGAKALVILSDFLPKFEEIKEKTFIKTVIVTSATQLLDQKQVVCEYPCYEQIFSQGALLDLLPRKDTDLDDTAILQYTGGTTGVSKGATLTHRNVLANSAQTQDRLGQSFVAGKEIVVCPLPLYHIYAFTVNMMAFFGKGAMNILIPNPRDMEGFVNTIKPYPFTALAGLNTIFVGLCSQSAFRDMDFSHLKLTISGGTALTKAAADLWFQTTGCTVTEGYGLSETAPVLAFNQPGKEVLGTVGPALIETEIEILDDKDQPVEQGREGQVAARGPQVMPGYWQRPEETDKVMTKDGFFKTGDVGVITSDGCLKIVDRLKDLIIVSGFNVYPNEVEDVLAQHPQILEAAVVGKEDEKTQERVCAFITVSSPIDEEEVIAFCRKSLTAYKVPKELNVLQELPKSTVGKVLRRELR